MTTTVKSSLTYQILLHYNKPFSIFFFISMLLLYLYKGEVLPYEQHVRIMEFLILLAFAPIEAIRISWGTRGNLTETSMFVVFSLFLSAAVLLICLYFGIFQNYVLLLEAILVGAEAFLVIVESLIGLVLVATL